MDIYRLFYPIAARSEEVMVSRALGFSLHLMAVYRKTPVLFLDKNILEYPLIPNLPRKKRKKKV